MIQTETTELVHVVITDQRVEQRRMTVGVVPIMTMMVVVVAGVSLWIITSLVGKTFDHLVSSQYAEVDSGESTKTTTHQQQQRKYLKQKKKVAKLSHTRNAQIHIRNSLKKPKCNYKS